MDFFRKALRSRVLWFLIAVAAGAGAAQLGASRDTQEAIKKGVSEAGPALGEELSK